MAIDGIPVDWIVSDEAWNNGIERNETTYVTGSVSLQWDDTSTTTDHFLYSSFFPVSLPTEPVEFRVLQIWITHKVTATGPDTDLIVEFWNGDKTTQTGVTTLVRDKPDHTGWQRAGGVIEVAASTEWGRISISPGSTVPTGSDFILLDSAAVEGAKPFIRATCTPSPAITLSAAWQTISTWTYDTTTNGLTSEYNLITIPDGSESWQGTNEGTSVTDGELFIVHEPGFYNVRASVLLDEWVSGDVYQARLRFYSTDTISGGHTLRHTIYGVPVYAGAAITRLGGSIELPVTVEASMVMAPYFSDAGPIAAWDVQIIRQDGSGTPDVFEAHCYAHKT